MCPVEVPNDGPLSQPVAASRSAASADAGILQQVRIKYMACETESETSEGGRCESEPRPFQGRYAQRLCDGFWFAGWWTRLWQTSCFKGKGGRGPPRGQIEWTRWYSVALAGMRGTHSLLLCLAPLHDVTCAVFSGPAVGCKGERLWFLQVARTPPFLISFIFPLVAFLQPAFKTSFFWKLNSIKSFQKYQHSHFLYLYLKNTKKQLIVIE